MPEHERWMARAVEEARKGIAAGQSPFGAVIVRGGALVAAGHNRVWATTDPTAHAEVTCLRLASAAEERIDFAGAVMYTTCEPCPMCAAAIHWAKLDAVYYGATIADAESAGFSELRMGIAELYRTGGSGVKIVSGVLREECAGLFGEWKKKGGRGY